MTYHFSYSAHGTYGHIVDLIDSLPIRGGVVLDLGCGFGAVAEPLAERGFDYVGVELDPDGVKDLRARGFEAYELDLWGVRDRPLAKALSEFVGERDVSAVLLLDVIEHCPDTAPFLSDVADAVVSLDRPLLVVSIPNVAHVDIAARLLAGDFSYTETGLLDRTHVQLWTEGRVHVELRRHGWMQVAANDFCLRRSDQFDAGHPLLAENTPLGQWVRRTRELADDAAYVNQFVRAFALAPSTGGGGPPPPPPEPALSVVIRTMGDRMGHLREALLCLAAQTDPDFEVELVVHSSDPLRVEHVQELVHEFSPDHADRIHVRHVIGGGRARPLNVGLDTARGRYVAFLDDDDLVTSDWVANFTRTASRHQARVIRSLAVLQDVTKLDGHEGLPYLATSGFRSPYPPVFDFVQHLVANQTPIHTFAVPRRLVQTLRLRFDESLPVTEDWDFLLRVTSLAGVEDTGVVTAIYHWWLDQNGSAGAWSPEVWAGTRRTILDRLTAQPMVLSPNFARQVVAWAERGAESRTALADAEGRAAVATAGIEAFERSRAWRATTPLRRGFKLARRALGKARRQLAGRMAQPGRRLELK
jgi:SAM-dependent methyltransferase